MSRPLEIVLLLALPASGKSEVRKYLAHVPAHEALRDFHMGPTVQLDDYPYVHLMRRIAEELRRQGSDGIFFDSSELPMKDGRDWGTLIELLNEDHADLRTRPTIQPAPAAAWLFERFDRARSKVGAEPALERLPAALRSQLAAAVETDAAELLAGKRQEIAAAADLQGKTIVVEFARGGPQGASMPLPAPLGYRYALARLSDAILERATILYIWVTPEESRRKNDARARPGREGDASILHHGVPMAVMLGDYGTDDMGWLVETSDRPGTVRIETRGRVFHLPVERFDNRIDKTTFVRDDPARWPRSGVEALHGGLREALGRLAAAR
jgi:hypothetical protein